MPQLWTIVRVLMLAASAGGSACGGLPTEASSGPQCDSRISGGTFGAVIDGVGWSTTSPSGTLLCGGFNWALTIHSATAPPPYETFDLTFRILRSLEPGVYPVGGGFPTAGATLHATGADGGLRVWLTGGLTSNGAATVSLATRERLAGTFAFVLAPGAVLREPGDTRTISVTNGTFDVRF